MKKLFFLCCMLGNTILFSSDARQQIAFKGYNYLPRIEKAIDYFASLKELYSEHCQPEDLTAEKDTIKNLHPAMKGQIISDMCIAKERCTISKGDDACDYEYLAILLSNKQDFRSNNTASYKEKTINKDQISVLNIALPKDQQISVEIAQQFLTGFNEISAWAKRVVALADEK